ncbi:ABC transporter ATP-binding protein [Legionella worsleiensis]|uniref:ABC transporter ATP binding transmembrane protein n=2 Tax=Legionella worsleiensis TaxID=45076 RepID=A0A0W1AIU2_9GAMM|nr:ABC transporter ATP binding transmembrane protein [Legionella worsleiensis]STY30877.1 ABC transporter ATP binding transmembrane protein [Legionella worsleiensis]
MFEWIKKISQAVVHYFRPVDTDQSIPLTDEESFVGLSKDTADLIPINLNSNSMEDIELINEVPVPNQTIAVTDLVSPYQVIKGLASFVLSKENIPRITTAGVLTGLNTGFNFLAPYLFGKAVELLMTDEESTTIMGVEFSRAALISFLVSAYSVSQLLPKIRDQILVPVTANNIKSVIVKSTEHLLKKSLNYHVTTPMPDMIYLIQKGFSLGTISTPLLTQVAPTILEIGIACGVLSNLYGIEIGAGLAAVLVLYTAYSAATAKPIINACEVELRLGNEAWTKFDSAIARYKTIHDFGKLQETMDEINLAMTKATTARIKATNLPVKVGYGNIALLRLSMLLGALYVGLQVKTRKYTVEEFMVLVSYLNQLSQLLPGFGDAVNRLFASYPDLKFVFKELLKPDEVVDLHPDKPLNITSNKAPSIEFKNVSFSYPPKPGKKQKHLFKDLSFTIEPGEKVAFVSRSGAGKTTIFNLLYRFYNPSSGSIKINGQDISELSLNSLRSNIALLGQNPNLFKGTLRDNIRFGALHPEEVTDEMIWELARFANLDDFLQSLKIDPELEKKVSDSDDENNSDSKMEVLDTDTIEDNVLDTDVGENGKTLSGGQQQKVAILRGLLKNSPIRLLDEITAPFDSHSATKVLQSISKACDGKTTLMITHKLTEAQFVDKIIVIDEGRAIAQGTHTQLMNTCKLYQELWNAYTSSHADALQQNNTESPSSSRKMLDKLGTKPKDISPIMDESKEDNNLGYAFNLLNNKSSSKKPDDSKNEEDMSLDL